MKCKECYFLTRITRNIWPWITWRSYIAAAPTNPNRACQLGFGLSVHVVALYAISRPYSVLIESGNCSSFTSITESQNCLPLSWQAHSVRSRSSISLKRGAKAVRCLRSQKREATALVFLQSFVRSAQLTACPLLRFVYEISAQFCHNFTIEPLCSPRNNSTVCNNTRSKHGAITVTV